MNKHTGQPYGAVGGSADRQAGFAGRLLLWLRGLGRYAEEALGDADASLGEVEGAYLVREVVLGWRLLAWLVGAAIVLSILLLAVLPRSYTATVIIQPSSQAMQTPGSTLASVGLKLGGLGESSVTPYARFMQTLDSYAVAEALQRKYGVLQKLYPSRWDAGNKTWKPQWGVVHALKTGVKLLLFYPINDTPGTQDIVDYIHRHLRVIDNPDSAIREIDFDAKDPAFARWFLGCLIDESDRVIRNDIRQTTSAYVDYLITTMSQTSSPDLKEALTTLMVEQERKRMMIAGNLPYAITVIDGPFVSRSPTSPKPALVLALNVLAAVLIGMVILITRAVRRQRMRRLEQPEAAPRPAP